MYWKTVYIVKRISMASSTRFLRRFSSVDREQVSQRMNEWMNEWMNEGINEWTDEWMNGNE